MNQVLPSLKAVLKKYDLVPKKNLGQNFLLDDSINLKIIKAAGKISQENILEIGPGPGGLTRAILGENPESLIVIEQDSRCIKALEELQQCYSQLVIKNEDALSTKEEDFLKPKTKIIANLPYNIATVLLLKWLAKVELWQSLTLMFQKEVAERITATPGTKDYGRLSVITQMLCDTELHFDLAPELFYPQPKVTSSLISLYPKATIPEAKIIQSVQHIAKILFNHRRKMLRVTLKQIHPDVKALLHGTDIELTQRPEELLVNQFVQIAINFKGLNVSS